jgi:protein involved in polysaccharide export with SLBB domain
MLLAMIASGCEVDSFMDPSLVGRWERTPVVLPILNQLDIIDDSEAVPTGLSQVMEEDLIPEIKEYIIGPGDVVTISVLDLMTPGAESTQQVRVDPLGNVRLRVIGPLKISGQTPTQLEEMIVDVLNRKGILKDAMVTIIVTQPRQNTYTVIGEPRASGTAVGAFTLIRADFRLLEAMALARGVSGRIKTIYVIRQVGLSDGTGRMPTDVESGLPSQEDSPLEDPTRLLEEALEDQPRSYTGVGQEPESQAPAPQPIEKTLDRSSPGGEWVHVGGKWVQVKALTTDREEAGDGKSMTKKIVTQRIIEVPYSKLLEGAMQYNIVIRPGDIISVPSPIIGNVFTMGAVNRPGTFALPGDKDLTLKQLIAAAGGLNQLAWPERVDLVRRVGDKEEAMMRIDLRAIFEGRQPDFFLKPNDMINVGRSLWSTPLAVIRNGFRMTYGFGFILDRNFGQDVFSHLIDQARR